MHLSRFRFSLPGPRKRPSLPLETNPLPLRSRPSLPEPRRRAPRLLETSSSSRLSRRQYRRRQVPPVSARQERLQAKPPRHVEVVLSIQNAALIVHYTLDELALTVSALPTGTEKASTAPPWHKAIVSVVPSPTSLAAGASCERSRKMRAG